jgi:protein O-mannosyl-transferase
MDQRPSGNPASSGGHRLQTLAICTFLLLAVALVFGPTVGHEFINLDDDVCVYENPWVTHGLSWDAVNWAFTHRLVGNWDPLTWMSHMLDFQLWGQKAGGHHLTNGVLHAATVVLLFLVLRRMSGRQWPSAVAAALFAIHPLRAESVAWVTERKDVLSGLFFVLTLLAYAGYVRRQSAFARCLAYLAMMVVFALGLMSKPMLVTLPCVLLLLDYWPLGRLSYRSGADIPVRQERQGLGRQECLPRRASNWWLVAEKLPLFAMSAVLCCVALWAERTTMHEPIPFVWRISDVLISYAVYLKRTFYPLDLAPLFPRRAILDTSLWAVFAAGMIMIGITAAAWAARRKCPYVLVGWLWWIGMLLPPIGVVSFGDEVASDRFTYLPHIGLCIAVVWGAADLCRRWPHRRWLYGAVSASALAALMACSVRQVSFWHDPLTLWKHTLECTTKNYMAHRIYGNALAKAGKIEDAIAQYKEAIRVKSDYPEAYFSLGVAEADRGRIDAAMAYYQQTIEVGNKIEVDGKRPYVDGKHPYAGLARNNIGLIWLARGESFAALRQFQDVVRDFPEFAEAHYNQGLSLQTLGHPRGAEAEFREALKLKPDYPAAYYNLGLIFVAQGRHDDAVACFRTALEIQPDFADARICLGYLLKDRRP